MRICKLVILADVDDNIIVKIGIVCYLSALLDVAEVFLVSGRVLIEKRLCMYIRTTCRMPLVRTMRVVYSASLEPRVAMVSVPWAWTIGNLTCDRRSSVTIYSQPTGLAYSTFYNATYVCKLDCHPRVQFLLRITNNII